MTILSMPLAGGLVNIDNLCFIDSSYIYFFCESTSVCNQVQLFYQQNSQTRKTLLSYAISFTCHLKAYFKVVIIPSSRIFFGTVFKCLITTLRRLGGLKNDFAKTVLNDQENILHSFFQMSKHLLISSCHSVSQSVGQ